MSKYAKHIKYLLLLLSGTSFLLTTCKKPFSPEVVNVDAKILVVEGLINSGADSTIIRLSRTGKIDTYYPNNAIANSEFKATVTIEDDQNTSYPLKETVNGRYIAPPLNLNAARNYRLRIKTADGQVYLSDYEQVKPSPPIDSVGFKTNDQGLTVYVNAHDAANNTRYYRWEYEEAWQFHAAYDSPYTGICDNGPGSNPPIGRQQSLYTCFREDVSSSIALASTVKLEQDVLYQAPVIFIPASSEKISVRYSVLVKQYVLTKAAYEFWTNLKKNTESLGSIFDAQPANMTGNIHCVSDPSKQVIGYASVGTVQRKRIFIDKTDVRGFVYKPELVCGLQPIEFKGTKKCYPTPGNFIVDIIYSGSDVTGITQTSAPCADCTTRGKLAAPPFWR